MEATRDLTPDVKIIVMQYFRPERVVAVTLCVIVCVLLSYFVLDRIPRGAPYPGTLTVCDNVTALMDSRMSFCHPETGTLRNYGWPFKAITRAEPEASSLRTVHVHSVRLLGRSVGRVYASLNALVLCAMAAGSYWLYLRYGRRA